MATQADLEQAVRKVLNEGTAYGQKSWAGTSRATLKSVQTLHNILTQQVLPKILGPSTGGAAVRATRVSEEGQDLDLLVEEAETEKERLAIIMSGIQELYDVLTEQVIPRLPGPAPLAEVTPATEPGEEGQALDLMPELAEAGEERPTGASAGLPRIDSHSPGDEAEQEDS